MIVATGLAAIATFTIVISSVKLQNSFGASAQAVEAWDKTNTLEAKSLTAYGYMVRLPFYSLSDSFSFFLPSTISLDFCFGNFPNHSR